MVAVAASGRFPRKRAAEAPGVSRSNLAQRSGAIRKVRSPYRKPEDEELAPLIRRLVDERPTYGYQRISAFLNRRLTKQWRPIANRKRVYRIMEQDWLLLELWVARDQGRLHDGKIMVEASDLRWCSDALDFACWNGEVVRMAFIIDAFDREIIAFTALSGSGVSGSDIRDLMLGAVETRFRALRAPKPVEHLSDNGSPYVARETRTFAEALNLIPCFTPIRSPEANGIAEAFVKTFKRNYLGNPMPDAKTALSSILCWVEDYNELHPHSALKMRSPREFIRGQNL